MAVKPVQPTTGESTRPYFLKDASVNPLQSDPRLLADPHQPSHSGLSIMVF